MPAGPVSKPQAGTLVLCGGPYHHGKVPVLVEVKLCSHA